MPSFLFWNLNRKPLQSAIAQITRQIEIDILMFAECEIPDSEMLAALNARPTKRYSQNFSLPRGIAMYSRLPRGSVLPIADLPGLSLRRIVPHDGPDILLGAIHFGSRLYQDDDDQLAECTRVSAAIREHEAISGHTRTILMGDFNMDPFSPGMVAAAGLHATMDRKIALRKERIVNGKPYPFFYNPMWNHLGDMRSGPTGSYFYRGTSHKAYFWHMFDQVLIRPGLLGSFDHTKIQLLTAAGDVNLADSDGRPDSSTGSDHFPLYSELAIER